MTAQPVSAPRIEAVLFSFTKTEINVMRLISAHWQKMYACHEIDRGEPVGLTLYSVWSPSFTLEKLSQQPSFRTDRVTSECYDVGSIGAQLSFPLCTWELDMLSAMVNFAIRGQLNRFLLTDKGVMADVVGSHFTQSWTCNSTAIAVAEKLDLLRSVAGLFSGHSGYAFALQRVERLQGVEAV
ncbi:hypothetical protein [Marinomonas posidonica]|uniref:hypothetical protein n=1 Tax=Marinomonas posidonica TaxID=936476 RepID=UPI0037369273